MKAILRYSRITSRKLRLVADLIRGKRVEEANAILRFSNKRGAYFLIKLLNSALANATIKPEINTDRLYVQEIMISPGVTLKRWRSAPRGRGVPIKKHTSHAVITLAQKAETKKAGQPKHESSGRKRTVSASPNEAKENRPGEEKTSAKTTAAVTPPEATKTAKKKEA